MTTDPVIISIGSTLCATICYLWRQITLLGRRLDGAVHALGQLQGLVHAVKACPVEACRLRSEMPVIKLSRFPAPHQSAP